MDLLGSKAELINTDTRDHLLCQEIHKVEVGNNATLDNQRTQRWQFLDQITDQSIDFSEFIDLLIVAEQDYKLSEDFCFHCVHQSINDHLEIAHAVWVICVPGDEIGKQRIKCMTKAWKTLTKTHEQNSKKGCAIDIALIEKIPTARKTSLFGKINQQGGLPISSRSMKQYKLIG